MLTMENYELIQGEIKQQLTILKMEQVSYIFGYCTIKFTSPYCLARMYIKTAQVSLAACSYNSGTGRNARKEIRHLNIIKGLNDLEKKREDIFIEVLHDKVSYIVDDCTIQFTS